MLQSNQYYTNNHIARSILRNHDSKVQGLAHWYNPLQWKFLLEQPISKMLKARLNLLILGYEEKQNLRVIQYQQKIAQEKRGRLRLVS